MRCRTLRAPVPPDAGGHSVSWGAGMHVNWSDAGFRNIRSFAPHLELGVRELFEECLPLKSEIDPNVPHTLIVEGEKAGI